MKQIILIIFASSIISSVVSVVFTTNYVNNSVVNTIQKMELVKEQKEKAKAEARWRQKEELNKIVRESAKEADEAHEKYMKEVWGDGIK